MAVITPPTIVDAPTPPDRADRATFAARATASFDHLKNHAIPEIQAVADNVALNATDAATSATTATTQAGTATAQAVIATDKAALTAADSEQTGLDATATASDRIATAADRVQTGLDRIATAADHAAVNEALAGLASGPVTSINGQGGALTLKTINSTSLLGSGDVEVVSPSGTQTLTNKTLTGITETVYALSGATPAFLEANGSVQTWTLSANSTPTDSLTAGQSIMLSITPGAYSITWPAGIVWTKQGGSGTTPQLFTAGKTHVLLWKIASTLYGTHAGDTV